VSPTRVLIGGGVRSGKSRFALARGAQLAERRVFLATAEAHDAEMEQRVSAHRIERGAEWLTREVPLEVAAELRSATPDSVVVVDCLTLWLSNLLHAEADVAARFDELAASLADSAAHCVLVTNEVGMGIVPDNGLARRFRDEAGRLHARLAESCDEVYFAALGCMLRLAPAPVELVR
jgi:adenosylcobinamide kinase / adenosylcobinamide-phosphate guanylyltransferase